MGSQYQLAREHPIDQRIVYDAVSYTEYQSGIEKADLFPQRPLFLPPNTNPRTAELARSMYAAAGSKSAYIEAVMHKFHTEDYYYTLEPPVLGNNPVDAFINSSPKVFHACFHINDCDLFFTETKFF